MCLCVCIVCISVYVCVCVIVLRVCTPPPRLQYTTSHLVLAARHATPHKHARVCRQTYHKRPIFVLSHEQLQTERAYALHTTIRTFSHLNQKETALTSDSSVTDNVQVMLIEGRSRGDSSECAEPGDTMALEPTPEAVTGAIPLPPPPIHSSALYACLHDVCMCVRESP